MIAEKSVAELEEKPIKIQPKRRKIKIVVIAIVFVLLLFRILLPLIVLTYVNNKLAELSEYYGHVQDIEIALFRGAYVIKDMKIMKLQAESNKKDTVPFFEAPTLDLSVEWKAIFKGAVVGEIYVENPKLNFVKGTHKNENVRADTADFRQLIKNLMPLTINHFEISNGQIHFIDMDIHPTLDIAMTDVNASATNLSNVNDSLKLLPAHLAATGKAYDGNFDMKVDFDALNPVPTFDLNATLARVKLPKLNTFLKAYGNFEVQSGDFGLYTEFAVKENKFGGYVKPLIENMKVALWKKDEGLKDKIWELLVSGASVVLKNRKTKEIGTKVPIEGTFSNADINTWRAISLLLRNAFVSALKPTIDNSININNLEEKEPKTLLEKIFRKNKK